MRLILVLMLLPTMGLAGDRDVYDLLETQSNFAQVQQYNQNQFNSNFMPLSDSLAIIQRSEQLRVQKEMLGEMRSENRHKEHVRYLCASDPDCK